MARVLFDLSILATDTRRRGIGRYTSELARGLGAQVDDLSLVFLEGIGFDGRPLLSDDPEASIARLCSGPIVGRWSWSYRLRWGAGRAAAVAGASIVHLPHTGATPLLSGGARRVVTCHDLIPLRYAQHYAGWKDGFGRGRLWLDRRRYRSADHIVAISQASADDLVQLLGVSADKITVVYNGIAAERWRGDPVAPGAPPYLVYAGDGDWRKNHTGMFAALARARREIAVELRWAGHLSDERRAIIEADARGAGVRDAVHLLGQVEDSALGALYRGALGMLFVSRAEGFGLPIVEAMASGCPVITSDCSSMAEIATGAALLVDPDDHEAIARAVVELASDAVLRARLIEDGRARAARFSLEAQARGTLAVYRRLLQG